jgi:hypothetical protein
MRYGSANRSARISPRGRLLSVGAMVTFSVGSNLGFVKIQTVLGLF